MPARNRRLQNRMHVTIREDQTHALEDLCQKTCRSQSDLAREALDLLFAKYDQEQHAPSNQTQRRVRL